MLRILYVGDRAGGVGALTDMPTGVGPVVTHARRPAVAATRLREAPFDCLVCEASATDADDGDEGIAMDIEGFLQETREAAPDLPVVLWAADEDSPLPATLYDRVATDPVALARAVASATEADAIRATDPTEAGAPDAESETMVGSEAAAGGPAAGGDAEPDPQSGVRVVAPADQAEDDATGTGTGEPPGRGLWNEQAFFDTVLDSLLDVFFVFDTERRLVAWNTRLEEVTGYDPDDVAGRDPLTLLAADEREEAYEKFAEVLTAGQTTAEFDLVGAGGERVPYEWTASLVTDADGAPRYICGIGRDVSELRRKEAELERKQAELNEVVEELRRSNAELEQFAYVASHDMKEPLRMVSSYLQLLERRYGDQLEGDAREFVEFAIDGAERMRRMIDQLLAFSRIDRRGGAFEAVDCEEVVDTVCRNLEVAIEESDATIEVGDLPTVTGDRDQLVQLFQNLLSNAIKYAGDEPPRAEVTATREGEMWEFAISDEGVGIPEDRIDRVFDIFYTDSEDDDSTGIGLAITRKIVERHDGDIEIESTVGEGTTVRFTLPDESVSLDEGAPDRARP